MDGIVRTVSTIGVATHYPMRLGMAVGLAWGVSAMLPATAMMRAHAQQVVPGYSYRTTSQFGTNLNQFVRGVDVAEDGVLWTLYGTGAAGTLKDSKTVVFNTKAVIPSASSIIDTYELTTRGSVWWGPYSPDAIWPNDLSCFPPGDTNCLTCTGEEKISVAIGVGGWYTDSQPPPAFETEEESVEIDACATVAATNAWVYVTPLCRTDYDSGEIQGTATNYLTTFVGMTTGSTIEINSVDTVVLTNCAIPADLTDDYLFTAAASGGTFTGDVEFMGECAYPTSSTQLTRTSYGGTDAFIALHNSDGRLPAWTIPLPLYEPVLAFGSSGDDGILGVSLNHNKNEVVVCGYFSAGSTGIDFDPGAGTMNPTNAGGRDLFVASYSRVEGTGSQPMWAFNWVRTYGTAGDDVAEGVWADVSGNVYVTGWSNNAGSDKLVYAKINGNCLTPGCVAEPWGWKTITAGDGGTVRGLDVCVDGLGRPVITGEFQGTLTFTTATGYSPATTTLASAGSSDGFVIRLDIDDGNAQWASRIGGPQADTSTDVAVCQYNTARLVHGGDFRDSATFNPIGGATLTATTGTADGYMNILDHLPEDSESVDHHITILMNQGPDTGASGTASPSNSSTKGDWIAQTSALQAMLSDPQATPDWRDGTVSLSMVMYSADPGFNELNPAFEGYSSALFRSGAVQAIPVITIRSEKEARWFGTRMRSHPWWRWAAEDGFDRSQGLLLAADYFGLTGQSGSASIYPQYPNHASYRHVWTPSFDVNFTTIDTTVRANVCRPGGGTLDPYFDQINAVAMRYNFTNPSDEVTRAIVRDSIADSEVTFTAVQFEKNLGIAGEVDIQGTGNESPWIATIALDPNPDLLSLIRRMFQRMTVCPADYNRNGTVEGTFTSGTDKTAWSTGYGVPDLYADWNFDGAFEPTQNPAFSGDAAKYNACFNAGCP